MIDDKATSITFVAYVLVHSTIRQLKSKGILSGQDVTEILDDALNSLETLRAIVGRSDSLDIARVLLEKVSEPLL